MTASIRKDITRQKGMGRCIVVDVSDIVSVIALVFSVVSFLYATDLFQLQFVKSSMAVGLDSFYWVFSSEDGEDGSLHICICNYSNRDMLVCFTRGYVQNREYRSVIVKDQYFVIKANSFIELKLETKPDYKYKRSSRKKVCLWYKQSAFCHFEHKIHSSNFREIKPPK